MNKIICNKKSLLVCFLIFTITFLSACDKEDNINSLYLDGKYEEIVSTYEKETSDVEMSQSILVANSYYHLQKNDEAMKIYPQLFKAIDTSTVEGEYLDGLRNYISLSLTTDNDEEIESIKKLTLPQELDDLKSKLESPPVIVMLDDEEGTVIYKSYNTVLDGEDYMLPLYDVLHPNNFHLYSVKNKLILDESNAVEIPENKIAIQFNEPIDPSYYTDRSESDFFTIDMDKGVMITAEFYDEEADYHESLEYQLHSKPIIKDGKIYMNYRDFQDYIFSFPGAYFDNDGNVFTCSSLL